MPFTHDDFLSGTPSARRLKLLVGCGAGLFFFLLCPSHAMASGVYSVKSFGAVGDGQHDDTTAIQSTIQRAAQTSGMVLLPPGTYLSGPLYLESNVVFDVEPNATLLASSDHTKFGEPQKSIKTDGVVDPDAIPDPTQMPLVS